MSSDPAFAAPITKGWCRAKTYEFWHDSAHERGIRLLRRKTPRHPRNSSPEKGHINNTSKREVQKREKSHQIKSMPNPRGGFGTFVGTNPSVIKYRKIVWNAKGRGRNLGQRGKVRQTGRTIDRDASSTASRALPSCCGTQGCRGTGSWNRRRV